MDRFYKVAIDKRPVGTAIEYREPPLRGDVVAMVTDIGTRGDFAVIAGDATDAEHQENLALPGVEELTESEASELATRYQPEATREERDREMRKIKKIKVPAVDLKKILLRHKEIKKRKSTSADG